MPADLTVREVCWAPRGHHDLLLHPISFSLQAGKVLGVIGPNGAGKTTLLRCLYRFHRPNAGTILVGDEDIWTISARSMARKVAVVLQEAPTDFSHTVREIVTMGRTPYLSGLSMAGEKDKAIVDKVLNRLSLPDLAERRIPTLSGGEHQRVMVARALAQEPQLLVLDEPTNHLDIRHQLEVLRLIRDLGLTVVTSLHDLNMAAEVCDEILMLNRGHQVSFGPPAEVLTEDLVSSAFQVIAHRPGRNPKGPLTFHLPTGKQLPC